MSASAKLPAGLYVSAVSTQRFELTTALNSKGRPYTKVVGRGVAGSKFVKVTQFIEPGQTPLIFEQGEPFEGVITGVDTFEKGREVISLFVELRRPVIAEVQGVKTK
jgi:hypothetical protein